MIEQHPLRTHHVAHGDDREIEAPGLTGLRIGRSRAGGAHAGADHVRADDEIALGVDWPARADHGLPPAGLAGDGMGVEHMLIAGERMADQHGVGALGIERAVGLVGDLEGAKVNAGIEPQRLVGAEAHDRRMRLIRLARAVGSNQRGSHVNHTLQQPCPCRDLIALATANRTAVGYWMPRFRGA